MLREQKTVCVVIDTNTWFKDSILLLNTPSGSELFYILRRCGGKIGLPEIIENELIKNIFDRGIKAVDAINKNFETVEKIIGFRWSYKVPDEVELQSAIRERLTELDDLFYRVKCADEHKESAQRRVDEKSAPNIRKPQFNDSAIWEAILDLLDLYTVHFVSGDNQFYKGQDSNTKELPKNLLNDCKQRGGAVYIHNNMESCLTLLWKDIPQIEYSNLILEINNIINLRLRRELLTESGFEIIDLVTNTSSVSAFFIEKKDNLELDFELHYCCIDIRNDNDEKRIDAILKIKGNCFYNFNNQIVSESDFEIISERIDWIEPSGKSDGKGVTYLSTLSIGGSQKVNYRFKRPIQ